MLLTKSNGMIIGPIASLLGMFMNGIFFVLNKIGIPNIGLAIIIMTILIYMAMLPLTVKQQKFSKLQRKMQPELNKINKKYEGRKDPESMASSSSSRCLSCLLFTASSITFPHMFLWSSRCSSPL